MTMEKEKRITFKANRRKGMTKIKAKINEIDNRKIIEKISETKSKLEKIKLINLYQVKKEKEKNERLQLVKSRMKEDIISKTTEVKEILREYCKEINTNKFR